MIMNVEYRELKVDTKCRICEHPMMKGEKAIVLATHIRARDVVSSIHPECVTMMKDMIDQDDEITGGNDVA